MLTERIIKDIENFLKLPIIQDYLSNDNLEAVYTDIFEGVNAGFSCTDFTDYLYGINIDPLQYSNYIYPAMFAEQEISEITIPGNIKYIQDSAFYGCRSLEKVVIEDGVIGISARAFEYCTALESIVIPESVKNIANSAFTGCHNFVIYCKENSAAHRFAEEHYREFRLI